MVSIEWIVGAVVLVVLILVLVPATVRIVQEYERGVVFRLGRLVGPRGPGLFFLIPYVEQMRKIDLRVITMDVQSQECITQDNVTVKVDAVVYFRVVDPSRSVVQVENYIRATSLISQTTMRSVVGQSDLDDILARREQVNLKLQRIIDEQTEPWGVKVTAVELRDVELPTEMRRAIARQAEAERERRAKVIHAEGEFQAAERLTAAAHVIAQEPNAIQLRFLQALQAVVSDRSNIVIFPVPIDLLPLLGRRGGGGDQGGGAS
ncbi:MAG: slipin family protein [Chloroflexi bacterium]|nr:slipin family protein [Chloroflexota bacterium]